MLPRPVNSRVIDAAVSMLRLFHRGEPLTLMPNLFVN
jgi:hypothetical protein